MNRHPGQCAFFDSPIGVLEACFSDSGLRSLLYTELKNLPENSNPMPRLLEEELSAYFLGELKKFRFPLDPRGTPFQIKVWKALQEIPYGRTISYEELALECGGVSWTRAVGGANGRNPINILIPCHRVVGAKGSLTGYGGGINRKKFLLELEKAVPQTEQLRIF